MCRMGLHGVKIDEHTIMLAVTEQRTPDEIDDLVDSIIEIKTQEA